MEKNYQHLFFLRNLRDFTYRDDVDVEGSGDSVSFS